MRRARVRVSGWLIAVAWTLAAVAPTAEATIPIVDKEDVAFSLSGYLRTFAALQHPGIDTLGLFPEDIGVSSGVLRLEWGLDVGSHVTFEVAQRLFWRVASEDLGTGGAGIGLGVSTAAERWIDLSTRFIDEDGLLVEHDIDRLALRLFFDFGDIVIGRQAITWGRALLFPSTDLFATFSPFDLDATEKPGSDAVRLLVAPWDRVELDFVVADRGTLEDVSAGVRANLFLDNADVFVGTGKFWNQLALLGGMSAEVGAFSLLFEATIPFDLDRSEVQRPRLTTGATWFDADWTVGLEYHFNGPGDLEAEQYLTTAASEQYTRGEVYLLGRHYLGAIGSYQADELVRFNLSVITNLVDPSAIIAPSATYDIAESVEVSAGAYVGVGAETELGIPLQLGSELGAAGNLFYILMAAYY